MTDQDTSKKIVQKIRIDDRGFVYADGCPVFRYIPTRKTIQFVDKDKRRCSDRGTRYVEIPLLDLIRLARKERDKLREDNKAP